jgi:hypothetical protein
MPSLNAAFETLVANYPRRDAPDPATYQYVDQAMAQFGSGTSCCVQMSQALNLAGIIVPTVSNRRRNAYVTINGTGYFYMGAVDEVVDFLNNKCANCFAGEIVSQSANGDIPGYLQGRRGILCFFDLKYGFHTELWDGHDIVQQDMDRAKCYGQAQVVFWDAGPPLWLTDVVTSQ